MHALRARDIDVVAVQGRLLPSGRGAAEFAYVSPDHAQHPVSILMLNGDSIPEFAAEVGEEFFRDRYTIGFYWWEVDPYPADAWDPALKYVDELWAGTEFVGNILRRGVDIPVTVVRVPVADPPPVTVDRVHYGLPEDATLFEFVYDYESSGQRKNPLGLVQAYIKTFAPDDGCHLLLKCLGTSIARRITRRSSSPRPAVPTSRLSTASSPAGRRTRSSGSATATCRRTAPRASAIRWLRRWPTAFVCTAYGGVLDFANQETARLVKYTVDHRPVRDPVPAGQQLGRSRSRRPRAADALGL